ncbi:HPr family phosphocarrier protein [Acidimicrobiaceae bacterium]|nr:HPr family phosphocarrier protein [Acidimicrobiaceae bacterium]
MLKKELVIKDEVGLHARPASLFVKLAQEFDGSVKIFFERTNPKTGQVEQLEKDGKSMIGVLSLGIERDNPFTLVLDGEDEEIYITKFEELLNSYE